VGQLLLVRHGQGSGGTDAELSPLGWEQARLLGQALADRTDPNVVVRGRIAAHAETAEAIADGAGWVVPVVEDGGWDGADEIGLLEAQPRTFASDLPSRAEFQGWFDAATDRWISGRFDEEYAESWTSFTARVDAALRRTVELAGPTGTAIVVTSCGPLAWVTASLIGAGATPEARTALWRELNRVVVNSAVTKLVSNADGLRLVSFNEHTHLETAGLTFR